MHIHTFSGLFWHTESYQALHKHSIFCSLKYILIYSRSNSRFPDPYRTPFCPRHSALRKVSSVYRCGNTKASLCNTAILPVRFVCVFVYALSYIKNMQMKNWANITKRKIKKNILVKKYCNCNCNKTLVRL